MTPKALATKEKKQSLSKPKLLCIKGPFQESKNTSHRIEENRAYI
jgi:hypothetical protein